MFGAEMGDEARKVSKCITQAKEFLLQNQISLQELLSRDFGGLSE